MYVDCDTPDGYYVDGNGVWIEGATVNSTESADSSTYLSNYPTSKSITDQLIYTDVGYKYGNKLMQEVKSKGSIIDAGSYYVITDAEYDYLGENKYGDPSSVPLATGLTFYISKDALIRTMANNGQITFLTAEQYYNTYNSFVPANSVWMTNNS